MKQKVDMRAALTALVSWLLSLTLSLTVLLGVLVCTVNNPSFLKSQILESGYHRDVWDQLDQNYKSYGNAGGIPESVMGAIITEDEVQQDLFSEVERFYRGERTAQAHPEVAAAALAAIEENLAERGIEMNDEIRAGIEDLANGCQVDYENYVRIPMAGMLAPYLLKLRAVSWMALAALGFLALAALGVLFRLQRSGPARLRWTIYPFSAAAVFSFAVPAIAGLTLEVERLNLEPRILRHMLAVYADGVLFSFVYFGLLCAVVAAVLLVAWLRGRRRYRAALRRQAYRMQEEDEV